MTQPETGMSGPWPVLDAKERRVLGVLVEGAVHTLAKHIPPERQAETVAELRQLLAERLKAHGLA